MRDEFSLSLCKLLETNPPKRTCPKADEVIRVVHLLSSPPSFISSLVLLPSGVRAAQILSNVIVTFSNILQPEFSNRSRGRCALYRLTKVCGYTYLHTSQASTG